MQLDFRKAPEILGDIVDAMAVGVFTVDAAGDFVAWSDGAARITGYSSEEIVGRPCRILEGPTCKGFATVAELLRSTDVPAGICNQECKVMAKNGHELYIHGNVRVLKDERQRPVGAVGTFTDVTSFVLANEKIALLEKQTSVADRLEQMVGRSQVMQEIFRRLRLAADSDVTVLLAGESGTGKELAAAAIHAQSARSAAPFLGINCSAIPESLLESELFGHVKGAFTGAVRDKMGIFQAADQGTLFLDEIGDITQAVQIKLLRVLQEREVRRVGDERATKVDVRLITATNKDLRSLIASGDIREDFYYRIRVFEINLPALRQRRDDIPLLAEHFVKSLNETKGKSVDGIARDAMQRMMDYTWPGNVRELQNAIEHAFVTVSGDRITYLDLPVEIREGGSATATPNTGEWDEEELAERRQIIEALEKTNWSRMAASRLLGFSRVTLWKKMGRYNIQPPA
jgi:PAS domain S-box-containing protein